MNIPNVRPRNSVRWPFRILASSIVAACVLGVIGVIGVVGHVIAGRLVETSSLTWQFLVALPGTVWLGRLAWHAAIHGKPPAAPHWPFASEKVLLWYVLAFTVVLHA